jgi:hypothetical protein
MKTARGTALGAALLAAAALTLSACGPAASSGASGGKTSASPTPSPTPEPKEQLTNALKALNSTSEKVTVSTAGKQVASGSVDAPNKAGDVAVQLTVQGVAIKMEVIAVGADEYYKVDLGAAANRQFKIDPKKYYKIDTAKVTDKSSLLIDPSNDSTDPLSLQSALSALADVKSTDGLNFTGTIDMTAASDSVLSGVTTTDVSTLGDKAKAVPFTATVNAQGQLTSFKTDGTGISNELTEDIEFSDFGTVKITAPAGAVAAPASLYSVING